MDDVYWYYSLEWCFFFFFLIKTKPQQKKRKKKLKPEKNTNLQQFCLRAEAAPGAGSTARCCPRGRGCRGLCHARPAVVNWFIIMIFAFPLKKNQLHK